MSAGGDNLPNCANCGRPVVRAEFGSSWRHYYTDDYLGSCYWGKPYPDKSRGSADE